MANRRILRANESEESVRQRAMNQAFKNFADYGARAMETQRRAEATKRQMALDEEKRKFMREKWKMDEEQRKLDNIFRKEEMEFKREDRGWRREDRVEDRKDKALEREWKKQNRIWDREDKTLSRKERAEMRAWKKEQRELDRIERGEDRAFEKEGRARKWSREDVRDAWALEDRGYSKEDRERRMLREEEDRFFKREDRGIRAEDRALRNKYKDIDRRRAEEDRQYQRELKEEQRLYGREDRGYKKEDRLRAEEDRQRRISYGEEDRELKLEDRLRNIGWKVEDREMSAIDRQRNWGDKLQQRNREYDREFLRNKRIEEDRAFAREDRGMKLEDRERRLQREEEDRLLALEQKELGLDKGYSEMAKRDFEEDQRALPYAQTRDAEKKVFEHKFAMEKQKAKLENDIKKAKKLAKAKGKNRPKESEFKAGGFAKRARLAEKDLKNLRADIGTDYTDAIQEWVPEVFKTDERKLFEQAKNNFISAVLRKESGAAISDEEYARENAKYFPSAGDGKNVIKQKERAREQAMLNLEAEGERALEFIGQAEREDQEGMGGMGAKEVDKSLPMMNDAEASGELKLKAEKFNRLQELRRKAQGGN